MRDLVIKLRTELAMNAYSVISLGSLDAFQIFCAQVGKPVHSTEVRHQPDRREFVYHLEAVPFHTDNPTMPIVGWYCVRQDTIGGEILLIDVRDVLNCLTTEHIDELTTLTTRMTNCEQQHRLLTLGMKPHISYMPHLWLNAAAKGKAYQALLAFHETVIRLRAEKSYRSVRLQVGDALFIDNQVILHARNALSPQSNRFLLRMYLQ